MNTWFIEEILIQVVFSDTYTQDNTEMVLERKSAKVKHVGDFLDRLFPLLPDGRSRLIPKVQ